ncbi:MAG: BLUF domain-containing protein [Burkholderiaceae bacterium]|nr:BLUF domain-containing protein [Burkholderiaceae bacterium]
MRFAAAAPLAQLVYTSRAVHKLDATDLQELVEAADKNNWRDEITGALLYHPGQVIEVLEGTPEDVSACFARISRDPRHRDCTLLAMRPISRRAFDAWSLKILPWSPRVENDVTSIFDSFSTAYPDGVATAIDILHRLSRRRAAAQVTAQENNAAPSIGCRSVEPVVRLTDSSGRACWIRSIVRRVRDSAYRHRKILGGHSASSASSSSKAEEGCTVATSSCFAPSQRRCSAGGYPVEVGRRVRRAAERGLRRLPGRSEAVTDSARVLDALCAADTAAAASAAAKASSSALSLASSRACAHRSARCSRVSAAEPVRRSSPAAAVVIHRRTRSGLRATR